MKKVFTLLLAFITISVNAQYSLNPIHPKTRDNKREFTLIYEKVGDNYEKVGLHYYDIPSTRCAIATKEQTDGLEFYKKLKFLSHRATIYFYEVRDTMYMHIDQRYNKHFSKYEPEWFDDVFGEYWELDFRIDTIYPLTEYMSDGESSMSLKLKNVNENESYADIKTYDLRIDRHYNYDGDSDTYYYILRGDHYGSHIPYNKQPTMVFIVDQNDIFLNEEFWKINDKYIHHFKTRQK
jgi:hypothetical protein